MSYKAISDWPAPLSSGLFKCSHYVTMILLWNNSAYMERIYVNWNEILRSGFLRMTSSRVFVLRIKKMYTFLMKIVPKRVKTVRVFSISGLKPRGSKTQMSNSQTGVLSLTPDTHSTVLRHTGQISCCARKRDGGCLIEDGSLNSTTLHTWRFYAPFLEFGSPGGGTKQRSVKKVKWC